MKTVLVALGVLAAILVIGCGGNDSSDDGSSSTSTTATTDGGSLAGDYSGTVTGSNTTGTHFVGTANAKVENHGDATFNFTTTIGGTVYSRTFDGHIAADGTFTGTTQSGLFTETAWGTTSKNDQNQLLATLIWEKHASDGSVFYTETEDFVLDPFFE